MERVLHAAAEAKSVAPPASPVRISAMTPDQTTGLLALMLLAALIGAAVSSRLRLPQIIGFIVAGLALRWALAGLAKAGASSAGAMISCDPAMLRFIKYLALAVVMFSIGLAFESRHLRRLGRTFVYVGLSQAFAAFALTFLGCALVGHLAGATRPVVMALFLGSIAAAISPAATLLTLRQYQAKGRTTDDILAITGLSLVVAIILFDVSRMALVQFGVIGPAGAAGGMGMALLSLVAGVGGSLLVGVVAGVVLSALHGRTTANLEVLAVLGIMLGTLAMAETLQLNFVLVSLVAGVAFVNIAAEPERMAERLAVVASPLFALLFVLAGYELRLEVLTRGPMIALVITYVVCRSIGKIGGAWLSVRALRGRADLAGSVGMGMLCHAEVKIALLAGLTALWAQGDVPAWVSEVSAVVIGSVALFEFAGPLLLRHVVVSAGEVKAFRLFHFHAPEGTGGWQRLEEMIAAPLRRLRILRLPAKHKGPLLARHVMHRNVKALPSAANLDQVLHFIERSHLDHFPVVDSHGNFAGTISLADVRDIIYEPDVRNLVAAQDLLEDDQVTASPDETLSELFEKFRSHRARDLIILGEAPGPILGIVEQRDVLRAMHLEQTSQQSPSSHEGRS